MPTAATFDATNRSEMRAPMPPLPSIFPELLDAVPLSPDRSALMPNAMPFLPRHVALPALLTLAVSVSTPTAAVHGAAMHGVDRMRPDTIALDWTEQKVSDANGEADDEFAYAVSVSGTTAAVGVPYAATGNAQGIVFVYTLVDGVWTEQQQLAPDDGVAGDGFGFSVSVSDDKIVIGAPYASVDGNGGEGAAYVFTNTAGVWSQTAKLAPDDGAASYNFGWSVALSGATAVVSAPVAPVGENALQGKAYIFSEDAGVWTQAQALVAADGTASATFGSSVALDGTTAVVGSAGVNAYFGAAYVFDGSGASWVQSGELVPDDGVMTEFFGLAVAVSGSKALVGAYNQRVGSNSGQGSAYVYSLSGGSWTQQQKLTASDGAASARFGLSVALDGPTALIGSYFANVDGRSHQGAAYVFTESGGTWAEAGKLVASDGAAGDEFGNAVALSGPTALVGAFNAAIGDQASQGAAYFYTQPASDTIFADGFESAP
jgi:hypothetical protein